MVINTMLSLNGCWRLVNATQNGKTPQEVRERCAVAEEWLTANKVISMDDYDDLMNTIAYIVRDSYH
jgi:hypothetical protein